MVDGAAIHIPFVLFSSFVCSSKKSENTEAAIPAGKTVDKHPLFHTKETNTPKKRTHKTKHSRRSVSDLLICNTQQSEARNKKQKQDSPRKIGKSDRVVSKTQTESPVPPAKNAKSIHPSSDISNRKGSQSQKRSEKKTTREDPFLAVSKLDEDTTIIQRPANRYEKDAGMRKMVVDPMLVVKRGNIDNIYSKTRTQFINKLREVELPSDRDPEQVPSLSKDVKIRFNDEKCVVYETNDEPTIDELDELGQDPGSDDIY